MITDESLAAFGLVPPASALPRIREILAREAELERSGGEREDDLALLCCVQLFAAGLREDILQIWEAKQSGFDLACSLDVQFLCGPGLEETKTYLRADDSDEARSALARIEVCEAAGDFKGFTPDGHLAHYRRYFGIP